MLVLNWNISQGGGSRVSAICRHIGDVRPDLSALTEFRTQNEPSLRAHPQRLGYPFIATSNPTANQNGLLVASKWQLENFNTGFRIDIEGSMFAKSHYMTSLIETGFVDTWRHQHPQARDYTWYSKRRDRTTGKSQDLNGFRLGYIFVSPPLRQAIGEVAILHDPRRAGAST